MEKKKSILILAESIQVEDSSGSKANVAFIKNLHKAGFVITVYHYNRSVIFLPEIATTSVKERKKIYYFLSRTQRIFQRITGLMISKFLENCFGFSFTFKNDVKSMVAALDHEKPENYDLIITLSKGASYRTHAALLKLPQWHEKWLAYIHDPYPFHWYPPPYDWLESGHNQKEAFFLKIAQKAQFLGYPSRLLAEWMGRFNSLFEEKSVVLPHQVITSSEQSELPGYFKKEKFTVLHAGNLLKQRDPYPLIKAWEKFLEANPEAHKNIQLLLIGPGSYHEPVLTKRCNQISSIYRSSGYLKYATVQTLEKNAAVNMVLEARAAISPFLPAKVPGLIQANHCILHLGPKKSETRRLLGEDYPWVTAADDAEKITNLLLKLYDIWKENPHQLLLNRKDLEDYFSAEYLKKQIQYLCEN
ncbi:UDP-glycosyltransferase [Leeuwenhoekiella sp. A2]|uniref:UDP-glycosyltransferase n=1 Tax=Leeuwenhoekiella sp. A2 TaxID=3141460 RepID=UPI003A80B03C